MLIVSILLGLGISLYTFIDLLDPGNGNLFWLYAVFFLCFISVPYSYHMPVLVNIAGESVPPQLRGKATGLVAASMSLGFAVCPIVSGPLFRSEALRLEHAYGSFSHIMWVICGFVNLIEFVVLWRWVGCGRDQGSCTRGRRQRPLPAAVHEKPVVPPTTTHELMDTVIL